MPDNAALDHFSLLGIGLYTAGEVERLTTIPAAKIRRWLQGYNFKLGGQTQQAAPLWRPQIPSIGGQLAIGFRDLTELRVVDALLAKGVSLQAVRRAAALAREILERDHPFSTNRFRTDGRTIFLQIADEGGDAVLIDLLKKQYGFPSILEKSLKDIDFGDDDGAVRWWPMGKDHDVVIDPARAFGQPIIHEGSVPTRILAEAVFTEGSIDRVAALYEVSKRAVKQAVAFESRMAA